MGKLRPRPAGKNRSREGHVDCLTQVACSSTHHLVCRQAVSNRDCKMTWLGPRQAPPIETQHIHAGPELPQASGKVLPADELIMRENTTRWGAQVSHDTALFIKLGGHVDQSTLWHDQGLWSSGALGLQGHEHLFTSHCAQNPDTSQDSCGNSYAHKCAFILPHICAVTRTVVHAYGHKAHTETWAPHGQAHYTHPVLTCT